jgi:predicted TPR repeat methyltransferase
MNRLAQLRALAAARSDDPFALYSLAMEERKVDLPAALATFARLAAGHPDYLATYYQHGKALEDADAPERAAEVYRAGIEVARRQGNAKTLGELETALDLL